MTYQTQIGTTEPSRWRKVKAENMQDAAITALRHVGPGVLPCTVYVGAPKPLHDNGAPMLVHAFDIVRSE